MNRWLKSLVARVKPGLAGSIRRVQVWRNRLRGYGVCVAGIRVAIDRKRLSYLLERRIASGRNQAAEFTCARALVHAGDVVLELGGGLGVLSAALQRDAAPSRIVSFEGNPDLLSYAKLTHQLNGISNIEVRHGVVLSRPQANTIPFYRHLHVSEGSLFRLPDSDSDPVAVPVFRLDELLAQLVPNFLIVDIQGGELDLFEGADTLGSIDRIALELHPQIYGSPGTLRVFAALCRLGFAYCSYLSNGTNVALERIR